MFFKYTKLNHEQQLLNQAIAYFKNDQQNYAYLEKKNNELYKLKHDLKYDYLQMKQAIKHSMQNGVKIIIRSYTIPMKERDTARNSSLPILKLVHF